MRRHAKPLSGAAIAAAAIVAVGWLAAEPSTAALDRSQTARPIVRAPTSVPPSTAVRTVALTLRTHENIRAGLTRAGLCAAQVAEIESALADDFDTVNPRPGLALTLRLAPNGAKTTAPRLVELAFQARRETALSLAPDDAGAFRLSRIDTTAFSAPRLVRGAVDGSLFLSLIGAAVDADTAADVARAFGRRLDLARDIESGDRFSLLFQQHRDATGRLIGDQTLLFAEIDTRNGPARLYRVTRDGAARRGQEIEFIDGETAPSLAALLRTPVDGARVTSGYGPRMHPILGFTRLHQGVDFAAPSGAPVLAAGDGVIEEAQWAGGYGRWLRIRHPSGLETGYAHLSAWAPGVAPGVTVRQGDIVAYVGESGLATGPHLHFEVFQSGQRIDPKSAAPIQSARATGGAAFRTARAAIDAQVAAMQARCGDARPAISACVG